MNKINKEKILKKWPFLILAVLAIVLISGCTGNNKVSNVSSSSTSIPVETSTAISSNPAETPSISTTSNPVETSTTISSNPAETTTITSNVSNPEGTSIANESSILTNSVTIQNYAFNPSLIHVSEGQTVTWTNKDSVAHTVTSTTGDFDSGQINSGDTFSYTFNKTGTIEYSCKNHPSMVHGEVVVIPK